MSHFEAKCTKFDSSRLSVCVSDGVWHSRVKVFFPVSICLCVRSVHILLLIPVNERFHMCNKQNENKRSSLSTTQPN